MIAHGRLVRTAERTAAIFTWRTIADRAKQSPAMLRIADRLGRSRGRLRVLDRLQPQPPAPPRPILDNWENRDLSAVWIGHATVLLRIGHLTVLTDPVFSSRVGLGLGLATLGPQRLTAAALPIKALPTIDLILLSHAHFDHLDRPTLARLPKRIPIVTANDTRDLIADLGFGNITELRWGERTSLNGLKITAHSACHWGARTFYDSHRGYNSYVLSAAGSRILYGGDTAYHEGFTEIAPVDLAILGIGAYDPYIRAHSTPEQTWAMANHAKADRILAMHHSTFRLSHEPTHEPLERLRAAAGKNEDRIIASRIGEQWTR
ncbi:MAG TPA: MBL fold metallo-hydrolase [Tepidisphaeraceae bacterium]|nr:MBL fold metallo-hydrolase [Tepidisphaeraceae bacterium]